ncbi:MAG: SGNH/GDSL hydrolase family protein [Gemmatimonadetes bacterium]|nr:SGNH/GDSL hydrolase family protein [Gemmatimonadota bacterium]MBI3569299.1 SGNH/GDSL hydrolase family protein [Gemmatimonadota bacterium]
MTHRFLALGDSYTIGEGVAAGERWPSRLAELLRASRVDVAAPEIVARTGWTTAELDAAITDAAPRGPYDLVSLLIGVNDQYRGATPAAYAPAFDGLLARAIGFAGGAPARVLVLSIPDWGVTSYAEGRDRAAVGATIDAFNRVARAAVTAAGAHWVEVTDLSREPHDDWLAADGLHPSAAQYAQWAARALPAASAALGY